MKGSIFLLILCVCLVFIPQFAFGADKWENLLIESSKVFEEMTKMPEEGIPESLLKKARAVAIFPSTVGGAFIIGGKYGQGVIMTRSKASGKWSAPAVFNIGGASLGWQIGGQATDIILLIMSDRGLDGLLQSKFQLGGDAAISAGPLGRDAQAATDLQLKGGILSYSRSRGAFIGLRLEGAVINFNKTANTSLYGKDISAKDILIDNKVKPGESAKTLMKDIGKY